MKKLHYFKCCWKHFYKSYCKKWVIKQDFIVSSLIRKTKENNFKYKRNQSFSLVEKSCFNNSNDNIIKQKNYTIFTFTNLLNSNLLGLE